VGEHYPRIRHQVSGPDGVRLLVREVVRIAFYMPYDHHDLAEGVARALDAYVRAVREEPEALCHGWDTEGEGDAFPLDAEGWKDIRRCLVPETRYRFLDELAEDSPLFLRRTKKQFEASIILTGGAAEPNGHELSYQARLPWRSPPEGSVSVLSVTLPTEYLEAHGEERVRVLAEELASGLRFSTGHAGLAFGLLGTRSRVMPRIREDVLRYPGLDVPGAGSALSLGGRVDGVHWLNFLGPPVLVALGGAAGVRARLHSPGSIVVDQGGERALVALGKAPEAGDLAEGRDLPAYRELARVLEPWLGELQPQDLSAWRGFTEDEVRRWWRRFLD
jgi:hypothetical protein